MEEIQIRDALRHHVTENEPPMGLSAAVLLSKGRRRHWWRLGVASGGTVAAITMVGTMALVPMGGADPSLDAMCGLIVITEYSPAPSGEPDHPSQVPSPYPTFDATPDPSGYPTPDPSDYPTLSPSDYPTFGPSDYPTLDPSLYPTPDPSGNPNPPWATREPSSPPNEPRMREMECYLKGELQRMVPGAKFAATSHYGPLSVYTGVVGWNDTEPSFVYVATAFIIGQSQISQFVIRVEEPWEPPTGPESGWSFERRGDLIIRQTRTEEGMMMSEVFTPHSMISTYSTGTLLSPEQLITLASAVEMDMFR